MIVFYNKKSGKIVGSIEGRIHDESHLRMYIGDEKDNGRIVCNWIKNDKTGEFEPEIPIFSEIEQSKLMSDYIVEHGNIIRKV